MLIKLVTLCINIIEKPLLILSMCHMGWFNQFLHHLIWICTICYKLCAQDSDPEQKACHVKFFIHRPKMMQRPNNTLCSGRAQCLQGQNKWHKSGVKWTAFSSTFMGLLKKAKMKKTIPPNSPPRIKASVPSFVTIFRGIWREHLVKKIWTVEQKQLDAPSQQCTCSQEHLKHCSF